MTSKKLAIDAGELSLAQQAGQRLMLGFNGAGMNSRLQFLIQELKVGGIILFSRNLGAFQDIRQLCHDVQEFAAGVGQPPLLIAIDQEGGQVARLKAPDFTEFPGNSFIRTPADAGHFASVTASELRAIGVNMNYAPVLDVTLPDNPGIMEGRSFGSDPELAAALGGTIIETLQQQGILAVAKHFPGIGRTVLDSHLDLPVVRDPLVALESRDLIPFKAAIAKGVSGVMLSHILYEKLDPVWPASLSTVIARDLLRTQLHYTGVVMTDDLDMGAVTRHFDRTAAVAQTLRCEIDQILICNESPAMEAAFEQIHRSIHDEAALMRLSIESVERILTAKRRVFN